MHHFSCANAVLLKNMTQLLVFPFLIPREALGSPLPICQWVYDAEDSVVPC